MKVRWGTNNGNTFCSRGISLVNTETSLAERKISLCERLATNTLFLKQSTKEFIIRVQKQSYSKMRQTRLPIDWIIEAEESSSSSSELEEEVKRGRPKHSLQWTRVKSLTLIKEQRLMVFDGK